MSITEVGGIDKLDSANLLKQSRVMHLSGRGDPSLWQGVHSVIGRRRQIVSLDLVPTVFLHTLTGRCLCLVMLSN